MKLDPEIGLDFSLRIGQTLVALANEDWASLAVRAGEQYGSIERLVRVPGRSVVAPSHDELDAIEFWPVFDPSGLRFGAVVEVGFDEGEDRLRFEFSMTYEADDPPIPGDKYGLARTHLDRVEVVQVGSDPGRLEPAGEPVSGVVGDEGEGGVPVPEAWRPILSGLADLVVAGDVDGLVGAGVVEGRAEAASLVRAAAEHPEDLVALPAEAWEHVSCYVVDGDETDGMWTVEIFLWSSEGLSELMILFDIDVAGGELDIALRDVLAP